MFFHHLKNFSPYSGHIYDDMRVPFIKKKDGYLGRNASRFDLIDRLYNQELSFELISEFLNIEDIAIVEILTANRFIGFQVFKRWEVNEKKLQDIVNKVISYHFHGKETATIIIQLMQY